MESLTVREGVELLQVPCYLLGYLGDAEIPVLTVVPVLWFTLLGEPGALIMPVLKEVS